MKLLKLLKFLESYVNKKGICYSNLAFVFEDPKHSLFDKLLSEFNHYKRISSHERHFESKNSSKIQAYGIDIPDYKFACYNKPMVLFKTLLLFKYTLINPKTLRKKEFLYVKPEKHGMRKLNDIFFHSINYVITRFYKEPKRAEHKFVKGHDYAYKSNLSLNICKLLPECKSQKQLFYTIHYRRGMEIYIPKSDYKNIL